MITNEPAGTKRPQPFVIGAPSSGKCRCCDVAMQGRRAKQPYTPTYLYRGSRRFLAAWWRTRRRVGLPTSVRASRCRE
ncbi:hypothetical protein VTK26DRAFT_568 [Humicola hyalothermophila]